MQSSGHVPVALHTCLCNTKGFVDMFVTIIRNESFVQTLCMPWAGTICCVVLAVCISSIFIKRHSEDTTPTCDSNSGELVMASKTRMVASSHCSPIGSLSDKMLITRDSSHAPSDATGAEFQTLLVVL